MLHLLAVLVQAADPAAAWGNLFAAAGAIGTSFLLAQFKKTDYGLAKSPLFRKFQPTLTLAGAFLAPWVAAHTSSHVDISGLGMAPIATLGTVLAAELLALLKRST